MNLLFLSYVDKIGTTLTKDPYIFSEGWEDYIDYINSCVPSPPEGYKDFNSREFGRVFVDVCNQSYLFDDDGFVRVDILVYSEDENIPERCSDEEWDKNYHKLEKDQELLNFIQDEVKNFIGICNESVSKNWIPENQTTCFVRNRFYIEVSPGQKMAGIDWCEVKIDESDFDTDDILNNFDC